MSDLVERLTGEQQIAAELRAIAEECSCGQRQMHLEIAAQIVVQGQFASPDNFCFVIEIERLRAQVEVMGLKLDAKDCLMDSQYQAGIKLGWNLCFENDEAGLQKALASTEHIAELQRIRSALSDIKREEG